ncbi:DUF4893 domain-containing protein [Sphingomonas sp. RP10(2022)]|uniref:DUF4893 domain-containing protein n=1 Tax=Sphingomonas liriopis TaxID=2949094 RepID=A0A9X2KU75_9SPHN|nr:DUF4893 domain-containing protein [Sphingomonas liriopis]MCP3735673.1 DUF4893 domain-containing protein [Sphingomonas liriopis]
MKAARFAVGLALAGVLLAGAAVHAQANEAVAVDWRKAATRQDRERLRQWRDAWMKALDRVRATPDGRAALAADAALFDPDRVAQGAALPPGRYRCRSWRLGSTGPGIRALLRGDWTACRVSEEGIVRRFVTDGAQRASGHLFDSTDSRGVFLGTLALGDEDRPMRYGRDERRDMAGLVERIGPARWRLVLPFPGFQSTLDVMEIVPA